MRHQELKELLNTRKFFKLVCGAGNEDAVEIEKLTFLYTLAGANGFDVSASAEIVQAAKKGIKKAYAAAKEHGAKIKNEPFITVSIGMRGDPHVRKALINEKCIQCGACVTVCPTSAISNEQGSHTINNPKCIGCGNCESICPAQAIAYEHKDRIIEESLKKCIQAGAESIELHAAVENEGTIFEEWSLINKLLPGHFLSMCLDRLHLSNDKLVQRIKKAQELTKDNLIIQADGVPMSGGKDDYNTTLQAIACADVILKEKLPVKILLSGGTNSKTAELADKCDVAFHGVSIGTFGRNIVKKFIQEQDFLTNTALIAPALKIARKLVIDNIGE